MSNRPKKTAGSHSAAPGQPGYVPSGRPGKGYYKSQVEREAFRQGMTVEEYGVYKGSAGSAVKPVNSAGGLLVISMIISVFSGISAVAFVILWVQDGFGAAARVLVPMLLAAVFTVWSWSYYVRERKAEKLRKDRGITLVRPE
ncbi:hypothetical protein SAMN04489740_3688 [Arthrobacter alpinus]|uniref:Uncharacterized protein n=1 Tax=Arthrobacter alpinus TaxID=656366 RepID=A0A1H5NGW2_9MICC|nr:hypothetical protein [Arthrobacter alpinus]SEF00684.1 hypothetical protein SAMN04489740_3688 [Arthrobacter alpinus]